MVFPIVYGLNLISLGAVFIWVFIACLGVPGALFFLISFGALASSVWELVVIIIVAVIAAILGDIFAYELARKFLSRLSTKLRKFSFFRDNEVRSQNTLKRYAFSFVFFTRFALTGLGAAVSYVSGFEKMERRKFILAVVLGEILYGSIYPILGYIFKQAWADFSNLVQDSLIAIVLIIVVIYLIQDLIKKRKIKKESNSISLIQKYNQCPALMGN
jgi:membrane-associated protein